jgi:hypothetical protein
MPGNFVGFKLQIVIFYLYIFLVNILTFLLFQNYANDNHPIYPGADVTKTESLLLIMCFVLRHKLTDVALGDLLLLLNTFFPNIVPATKHLFYKLFKLEQSEVCTCILDKRGGTQIT